MSIFKYFLILISTFTITFLMACFVYSKDIKSHILSKYIKQSENISIYLKETLKQNTIDNDQKAIDSTLKTFLELGFLEEIELKYNEFYFSKKAILNNSRKITDNRYILKDVTTDYINGTIKKLDSDLYLFSPSDNFNINKDLKVKFQSVKNDEVYNSISYLNFYKILKKEKNKTKYEENYLDKLVDFDDFQLQKSFVIKFKNKPYVKLSYSFSNKQLILETKLFIEKIFIYSISLFVLIILILYIFYYKILSKNISQPLKRLSIQLDELLSNKFVKIESTKHDLKIFNNIDKKVHDISKKLASLNNELNINKDILQRRDFIDEVTGLPNKKVFEKDIKTMFVTNKFGYIILAKISNLAKFAKENGSNDVNRLIEDFGHGIDKALKKEKSYSSKVYRFYGAEFAIIIQIKDIELLNNILQKLIKNLEDNIKGKYLIDGSLAHFGATPFDNYGTIDSILHSAHESYTIAIDDKKDFYISDNAQLIEKTKTNEKLVKDVIQREDFAVKFIYDTYDLDNDNLIMQDASPVILNSETFESFPIGIFISIAEKLGISSAFDKIMVKKVIEYLKTEKIKHKIVVNLSIKSLTDKNFLSWLEGTLLYEDLAKQHIIFSITSYNAKSNLNQFKNLVEVIHKFDSKIVLKRFSLDDFSLDELNDLNIDYLRLNKDYCQDIDNDRLKKHSVKSIILHCQMHDIIALGDLIKSEDDLKTMKRLGLDATSK